MHETMEDEVVAISSVVLTCFLPGTHDDLEPLVTYKGQ